MKNLFFSRALLPWALAVVATVCCGPVVAGAPFSPELTFTEGGQAHHMRLTGEDERVFLIFRVYDIAHYAETPGDYAVIPDGSVVSDGPAKAIVLRFARKLGRDRIRAEFDKTIRRNAEAEWLERAEPTIAAFIGAIDRDALAGDELTYYWLEGGRLIAEYNDEQVFAANDADFAKLIWSIWFGEDPVCDSEKLLAGLPVSAPASGK